MIDWSRIDELKEEFGADDFAAIVDIFLEEVDEAIVFLEGQIPDAELGAHLHFLKGGALNLGFTDFASLCQKGESLAEQERFAEVDIDEVLASYRRSKREFLAGLADRDAA